MHCKLRAALSRVPRATAAAANGTSFADAELPSRGIALQRCLRTFFDLTSAVSFVDLTLNSVWLNLALFAVAAAAIWLAGGRLERYADAIAEKTGLGRAFLGLLLLAVATSLPEISSVVTASLVGNTALAVHNLLGAVVINAVVLAIADMALGRGALTYQSPSFALLMQGIGLLLVLTVALMGMTLGGQLAAHSTTVAVNLSVGLWSLLLLAAYLIMLYLTYRAHAHPRWQPVVSDRRDGVHRADPDPSRDDMHNQSLKRLGVYFGIGSVVVLLAGSTVARVGDALASQTGLGGSFIGFTLVSLATCLPELSITVPAVRGGNTEMAFGNVFGSSAFNVMLLLLVALLSGGAELFANIPASAQFASALGIFLTCLYIWGLLERQNRTVLRMGWDSAAVLVFASVGFAVVFWVK